MRPFVWLAHLSTLRITTFARRIRYERDRERRPDCARRSDCMGGCRRSIACHELGTRSGRHGSRGNRRRAREQACVQLRRRRSRREDGGGSPQQTCCGRLRSTPLARRIRAGVTCRRPGRRGRQASARDLRWCSARSTTRRTTVGQAGGAQRSHRAPGGPGRQHRLHGSKRRSAASEFGHRRRVRFLAQHRRAHHRFARQWRRLARHRGVLHELSQRGCALHRPASA